MFEQALMSTTRNKPWSLGASITLQSAIVGTMVLYSALHVDVLPLVNRHLELPMPFIQKAIDLVPVPTGVARQGSILTQPRPFVAPTRIPDSIAKVDDIGNDAPIVAFSRSAESGPPGVSTAFALDRVVTAPPPKPPAAQTVVQSYKPSAPTRVSSGVMEAMIVKRVMPVYPPMAKNARISGKVHLMGIIAKDGTIQKLELLDGHPLLVRAALDAVRQWIYRPTLLNGEPVDVISPIEVNFVLTQ